MAVSEIDRDRMREACEVAKLSPESVKVGCIIADSLNSVVAKSVNQNVTHFDPELAEEILHAERGAMIQLWPKWTINYPLTLYTTKAVCYACAFGMAKAGITRVVMPMWYKINPSTGEMSKWWQAQEEAVEYLKANGVIVDHVEIEMRDGVPYLAE